MLDDATKTKIRNDDQWLPFSGRREGRASIEGKRIFTMRTTPDGPKGDLPSEAKRYRAQRATLGTHHWGGEEWVNDRERGETGKEKGAFQLNTRERGYEWGCPTGRIGDH